MPNRSLVHHLEDVVHRSVRWLSADPGDVLVFTPRTTAQADGDGRSGVTAAGDLDAGLGRWQRAIEGARRLVVARRALTVAVGVLLALLLGRVVGASIVGWLLIAAPLTGFALVVGAAAALTRPRLGPALVAQLLDRGLALAERLGTAWELRASAPGAGTAIGAGGPLAARVVAQGDRLVWDVQGRYRVRPRPAGRAWGGLAVAAAAAVLLAVLGPSSGDPATSAGGARSASTSASAAADAARATATAPTTTPATATPGATPPSTATRPGATTTPGQPSAASPTSRAGAGAATPPSIAVRAQPITAGATTGASSGGRTASGSPTGRAGAATGAAKGSSSAAAAPVAASVPTPKQIKGIAAQGQKATHAVGTNQTSSSAAPAGARGSSQSGTQGAGSKAGRVGATGTPSASTAAGQSLPLRSLATDGGRQRGTKAGRAGTGGTGRGTAQVQRGGTSGAGAASASAPLPIVPSGGGLIAPSLQDLVSAYFTTR